MTETDKTLLLIGATSDIGRAIAARYAQAGWSLILTARTLADAEREARDLATRYAVPVRSEVLDLLDLERMAIFAETLDPAPDTVVSVVGVLGDQGRAETDVAYAAQVLRANFEGPALILGAFAARMAARGSGAIVGVSSVAGERGRASLYVYGSAKAGLTAYLSGLRQRLAGGGLRVITVKPGYVRTRMTEGLTLPAPLTAAAAEVGEAVFRAAERGGGDVVYVRWPWRWIMAIIKLLPEFVFKRMRF
jgi:decaprenylphospho-beta-D-erythro-pentofuranosid-2-ulose 2-reductase